ncbi:MAG: hypothetical protein NTX03_11360, partial [Bacteroidetes bacterium]|nr:hypothetical protein [Bacteroidota bacterium]
MNNQTANAKFTTTILLFLSLILFSGKTFAALNGTYTINKSAAASSTNYKSFRAAVNDLTLGNRGDGGTPNGAGVSGAVTFNIANGTYTETVVVNAISGTSPTNTVTFQSASGDSTKVILDTASTNNSNDYVLQLNSASYVTFKQMTFTRKIGTNYYVNLVNITGSSYRNQFLNCRFIGLKGLYGQGIYSYGINDSSNIIKNNYFLYNTYSIYLGGGSTTDLETSTNIDGNFIDSPSTGGMVLYYQDGLKVNNNTIKGAPTYYGIVLWYCYNGLQINKNKLVLDNTYYGLYLYVAGYTGGVTTQLSPGLNSNNTVSMTGANCYYGLYSAYCLNQNYYNNSVLLYGTTYASSIAGYFVGSGTYYTNNNVMNNIFVNKSGTLPYANTETAYIINSDYNDFYASGSYIAQWVTTKYTTLSALRSASGKDYHSINLDPSFTSSTNLHIGNTSLNSAGKNLAEVVDDIDGQYRSPNVMDIGADEIFPASNDAGISQITPLQPYSSGSKSIMARLNNFGANNLTSATINWKFNGTTQTAVSWTGTLTSGQSTLVSLGTQTFSAGSTYSTKVWTSVPNGTSDGDVKNDTLTTTTCPGLTGTYTIGGSGANFASFNAAIYALSCGGLAGPVLFKVNAGTYTEQVDLAYVKYASPTNTITFDGGAGNAATRILNYNSTSNLAAHTFRINNTPYVTVKN